MEELTQETYITDHSYMSYSRFCKFMRCEASAIAGYRDPPTTARLIGSYVDAVFSNEKEQFIQNTPELFTKKGELRSDFVKADLVLERCQKDKLFMEMMSGEKQRIMTGVIAGVPFKIKIDSYIPDKCIVDLKVMESFDKVWSAQFRASVSFIEAYNYDIEMAVFQEIVRQNTGKQLPCYLACATKENPPDIGIFQISQEKLDKALDYVVKCLPRIKQLLDGKAKPHRCNKCGYCRSTKQAIILDSDFSYYDGDMLREVGIECDDEIKGENNG